MTTGFPFYFLTDIKEEKVPITGDSLYVGVSSGSDTASKIKNVQMSHGLGSIGLGPIETKASLAGVMTYDTTGTSYTVLAVQSDIDWERLHIGAKINVGVWSACEVIRKSPNPLPLPGGEHSPLIFKRIQVTKVDQKISDFVNFSFSTPFYSTYHISTDYFLNSILDEDKFVVNGVLSLSRSANPGSTPDIDASLYVTGDIRATDFLCDSISPLNSQYISAENPFGTEIVLSSGEVSCPKIEAWSSSLQLSSDSPTEGLVIYADQIGVKSIGKLSMRLEIRVPASKSLSVSSESNIIFDYGAEINGGVYNLEAIREQPSVAGYGRLYCEKINIANEARVDRIMPHREFPSTYNSIGLAPAYSQGVNTLGFAQSGFYDQVDIGTDIVLTNISSSNTLSKESNPEVLTITEKLFDPVVRVNRELTIPSGDQTAFYWGNYGKIDEFALEVDSYGEGVYKRPRYSLVHRFENPPPIYPSASTNLLSLVFGGTPPNVSEFKYMTNPVYDSPYWIKLPEDMKGVFRISANVLLKRNGYERYNYTQIYVRYFDSVHGRLFISSDGCSMPLGDYRGEFDLFYQELDLETFINRYEYPGFTGFDITLYWSATGAGVQTMILEEVRISIDQVA